MNTKAPADHLQLRASENLGSRDWAEQGKLSADTQQGTVIAALDRVCMSKLEGCRHTAHLHL